jgi:hypothetical protein
MSVLDPRDADRFGKIIGLLGSNHDGERAAAALKATEFLRARQLGWPDVAEMLKPAPVLYAPIPGRAPRCHQVDARQCLASGFAWKPHEADFLRQMTTQRQKPSERQAHWLDGLLDRATRAARGRA